MGFEVGSMILATAFADADEFFRVEAVAVAFSYGLCFELVVVYFLNGEHFTPILLDFGYLHCAHLHTTTLHIG